ncbi:hypothetical protein [Cellulomonas sp. NPDC089187]|uniref:hypothetical protein n=1 Tax=Cellulomonas sp. NPDC089187 TaxID=3154970 RepID=UPI003449E16F
MSIDSSSTPTQRTRWGRTRGANGGAPAFWTALPVAVLLAAGIGAASAAWNLVGPRPLLGGSIIAAATVWPIFGLVWVLLVDRSTLRGTAARPDETVESAWYRSAASGAFTDLLIASGIGLGVVAMTQVKLATTATLCAVLAVGMGSFAVRYLIQRRQG